MVSLRRFIARLRRRVVPIARIPERDGRWVPDDVKEGQFAVMAGDGEDRKRFVVGIKQLSNRRFESLLDVAYDEYGSRKEGLIVIPCSPDELQRILADGN